MPPTLLERRIRIGHLAAVADGIGDDRVGSDYTDVFGLQDAQETEVRGAG